MIRYLYRTYVQRYPANSANCSRFVSIDGAKDYTAIAHFLKPTGQPLDQTVYYTTRIHMYSYRHNSNIDEALVNSDWYSYNFVLDSSLRVVD